MIAGVGEEDTKERIKKKRSERKTKSYDTKFARKVLIGIKNMKRSIYFYLI